jgi:AAT family amino acid transporter
MGFDCEKLAPVPSDVDQVPGHDCSDPKGDVTPISTNHLARNLSARQVSMIAIGGTIGTGLFLGTGKAFATGGPGSTLVAYAICGLIIFLTMLCLGEMAAFIPVSGSFCTFAGYVKRLLRCWNLLIENQFILSRFVDDSLSFALTWNYWFNDAVSTAADLLALQILFQYWTEHFPGWAISLIFLLIVLGFNLAPVGVFGEVSQAS